jgi:hypothetical protein
MFSIAGSISDPRRGAEHAEDAEKIGFGTNDDHALCERASLLPQRSGHRYRKTTVSALSACSAPLRETMPALEVATE